LIGENHSDNCLAGLKKDPHICQFMGWRCLYIRNISIIDLYSGNYLEKVFVFENSEHLNNWCIFWQLFRKSICFCSASIAL